MTGEDYGLAPAPDALPAPRLAPAPAIYVTGEDVLKLTALNAAAGVTLKLTGRVLPACGGHAIPFSQTLVPATDRTVSTVLVGLVEGWLLNAHVVASAGTPPNGQTFVLLSLAHGLTAAAEELHTLAAGYVTAKQRIAFPGSPVTNSLEGGGALRSITGTTPAAGAEISETVPAGARWEPLAFTMVLTTSVAVAGRLPTVLIDDGTTLLAESPAGQTQAASLAYRYTAGPGLTAFSGAANQPVNLPLPVGLRIAAGYRIRSNTGAIQAADQYSAVQYLVREWIEGA